MIAIATVFGFGHDAPAPCHKKRDLPEQVPREPSVRNDYWNRAFTLPQDDSSLATMQLDVWEPR